MYVPERRWNVQGQIVTRHLDKLIERFSLVDDKLCLDDEMSCSLDIAGCVLYIPSIRVRVVNICRTLDVYIGLAIGLWH